MGNWDGAIFRSIGWVLLLGVGYSLYEIGIPVFMYPIQDFLTLFGWVASVYLALSVAGWLTIGLPFHWAICKWSKPKYLYYLLPGALIVLAIATFGGLETGIVFGVAATLQALIFRLYVFKSKKDNNRPK